MIEVGRNLWDGMTPQQRRALVDHELCHLSVEQDDDGSWVGRTRGHDVEEFVSIIDRHGLWKADVAALASSAAAQLEQLTFELVDGGGEQE